VRTARQIVESALSKIGVTARGQNLATEDANLAFQALVDMLAEWHSNADNIPVYTEQSVTLTAGQQQYTVGPSQDLNITLPIKIASIKLTAPDIVMRSMSFDQWSRQHQSESGIPARFFYQYNTVGNLWLDRPPAESYAAKLYVKNPLQTLSSLNDDVSTYFDEGDVSALVFNLAVEVADDFGGSIGAATATRAAETKQAYQIAHHAALTTETTLGTTYYEYGRY